MEGNLPCQWRATPCPGSICRFSLNPTFGPAPHPHPPQFPQDTKLLQKPTPPPQWGSCLAARGQGGPGGRDILAAPHSPSCQPDLAFHGAGGTPEPLQGSGWGVGDLVASQPLPRGTLNCSVWFSGKVNEPLSAFHLSKCQVFWSTAVSLFSLCKFTSFFISLSF